MEHPEIIKWPDPILCERSTEADIADPSTKALAERLLRVMNEAGGLGLAAVQIGVKKRVAAFSGRVFSESAADLVLVNPAISSVSGEAAKTEACLSFPGIGAVVTRPETICVSGFDPIKGAVVEASLPSTAARCVLHEIDHMDGRTYPDLLSPLKKRRLLEQYAKSRKAVSRAAKLKTQTTP